MARRARGTSVTVEIRASIYVHFPYCLAKCPYCDFVSYAEVPGLFDRVVRAMQMDKKFRDGKNVFVLPTGAGEWEQAENVPWDLVHDAVRAVLV